jgi:hypothetical protein
VRDALVGAAGGNPLALIELPRSLTPDQLRGREPLPDPLPVGDGLERVFLDRVRFPRPELRAVLLLCAAEAPAPSPPSSRRRGRWAWTTPRPRWPASPT